MSDQCCCPSEAGNMVCELPPRDFERRSRVAKVCPKCNQKGKPVERQTVKAMISVSLRELRDIDYLFCRTETCPVVYFTVDGLQIFTKTQVREQVYQKEPGAKDVFVCYCFRHTAGDIQISSSDEHGAMLLEEINTGIKAGQCACDLRNPQGSCCLGNVRGIIVKAKVSAA